MVMARNTHEHLMGKSFGRFKGRCEDNGEMKHKENTEMWIGLIRVRKGINGGLL
jgi:hypothetical protein